MAVKVVYMCSAESEDEAVIHSLFEIASRLVRFDIPSFEEIKSLPWTLLRLGNNPGLSMQGIRQLADIKMALNRAQFPRTTNFDIALSSNAKCNRDTLSRVLQGTSIATATIPCLEELTFAETIIPYFQNKKFDALARWLKASETKRVFIVGNRNYFSKLLKTKLIMQNCDINETILTWNEIGACAWDNTTASSPLFRSALSEVHPFDVWTGRSSNHQQNTADTATVATSFASSHDTGTEGLDVNAVDEPCCRICQVQSYTHTF